MVLSLMLQKFYQSLHVTYTFFFCPWQLAAGLATQLSQVSQCASRIVKVLCVRPAVHVVALEEQILSRQNRVGHGLKVARRVRELCDAIGIALRLYVVFLHSPRTLGRVLACADVIDVANEPVVAEEVECVAGGRGAGVVGPQRSGATCVRNRERQCLVTYVGIFVGGLHIDQQSTILKK